MKPTGRALRQQLEALQAALAATRFEVASQQSEAAAARQLLAADLQKIEAALLEETGGLPLPLPRRAEEVVTGVPEVWARFRRLMGRAAPEGGLFPATTEFPDVLDLLGKTPREIGAIHVHVEPVVRDSHGHACANVWLQAAFSKVDPGGTIQVLGSMIPIPDLGEGRVMQGRLPVFMPSTRSKLRFEIACAAPAGANRIRRAWKLLDTYEQPTESELKRYSDESAHHRHPRGPSMRVLKAPAPASCFVAKVIAGQPERLEAAAWTEIWRAGQPLPEAGSELVVWQPIAGAGTKSELRVCHPCGFSGKSDDFATDRFCPSCGTDWD